MNTEQALRDAIIYGLAITAGAITALLVTSYLNPDQDLCADECSSKYLTVIVGGISGFLGAMNANRARTNESQKTYKEIANPGPRGFTLRDYTEPKNHNDYYAEMRERRLRR